LQTNAPNKDGKKVQSHVSMYRASVKLRHIGFLSNFLPS